MNWYTKSKNKLRNQKKHPFLIVMNNGSGWSPIVGLEEEKIYAYSPNQAMFLFVNKFPKIKDYQEMGFYVDVVLDQQSIENEIARDQSKKLREQEVLDNAWWNK